MSVVFLSLLSLIPWFLFGLAGPNSDANLLLECAAGKYGLMKLQWMHMLYTAGPEVFLAPLLFVLRDHWFFWTGSALLALASVAATLWIWWILTTVLSRPWMAFLGAALFAFHPMVHQLHFYWMTELYYVTGLMMGLFYLSRSWSDLSLRPLILSSAWLMVARLMRPQTDLIFFLGFVFILFRGFRLKNIVRPILAFVLPAFLMSAPFRCLNYHYHDTWVLSKTSGNGVGFFLNTGNGYHHKNGPESARIYAWCQELLTNPNHPRTLSFQPSDLGLFQSACRNVIQDTMNYSDAKYVYFWATGDWQKADEEVGIVVKEAIRANPKKYIQWVIPRARWTFGGISENPGEWQDTFEASVEAQERYSLKLSSYTVTAHPTFQLASRFPNILILYNTTRTAYAQSMHKIKRLTIVSLPFLLWLVWKRFPREDFVYLALSAVAHLCTGLSLAMIIGFQHRYANPLEMFNILYLVYWLDVLRRSKKSV